jgi:hypothetical protein
MEDAMVMVLEREVPLVAWWGCLDTEVLTAGISQDLRGDQVDQEEIECER